MDNQYFVIMAGGVGTRFWPASTPEHPKQFLPLGPGGETLIEATFRRCRELAAPEQILVVTAETHRALTLQALPALPKENLLLEPIGRNTAPCVAWASHVVANRKDDAVIAVLPADQHIKDEAAYTRTLSAALDDAKVPGVVTVGIRPTRPETGFGYIEMGSERSPGVFDALRFVEKPDRKTAEDYLEQGTFLWNSGMFFFRAQTMIDAIAKHLPNVDAGIRQLSGGASIEDIYPTLPSISIDHGIMEKVDGVRVLPGSFGWSDLGSWLSAWELADKDEAGNAVRLRGSQTALIDSSGCYVDVKSDKSVALLGVTDLVVVDTGDALLIMPKHRSQDVKAVVEAMKRRNN